MLYHLGIECSGMLKATRVATASFPLPPSPHRRFFPYHACWHRIVKGGVWKRIYFRIHLSIAGCFDGFQQMLAIPNDNLFLQRSRPGPSSFFALLYYGPVAPRKFLFHRRRETSFLPKAELLNRDLFVGAGLPRKDLFGSSSSVPGSSSDIPMNHGCVRSSNRESHTRRVT